MFNSSGAENRPALLRSTIKATAGIAALATLAGVWLSAETLDRGALARFSGTVVARSDAPGDPVTTGSLAQAANGAKLDPCARARVP